MVTIKEEKKEKRNFKSTLLFIAAFLLLAILIAGLVLVLVFTNKTKVKKERVAQPNDITSPLVLDDDNNLLISYEDKDNNIKENLKFSSNASNIDVDVFETISYLYHMKDSNPFTFNMEYTVTGVKYSDMEVKLYQSDKAGLDIVEIPQETYTVNTIDNGVSLTYECENTDLYIYKVKVSYFVY